MKGKTAIVPLWRCDSMLKRANEVPKNRLEPATRMNLAQGRHFVLTCASICVASRCRRRDCWPLQRFLDPMAGKERVCGRDHKQRQKRSEHESADDNEADRRARFRTGPHR